MKRRSDQSIYGRAKATASRTTQKTGAPCLDFETWGTRLCGGMLIERSMD